MQQIYIMKNTNNSIKDYEYQVDKFQLALKIREYSRSIGLIFHFTSWLDGKLCAVGWLEERGYKRVKISHGKICLANMFPMSTVTSHNYRCTTYGYRTLSPNKHLHNR